MSDVIVMFGNCKGKPCKHFPKLAIVNEEDRVVVNGNNYHKGCEPTMKEHEAAVNSYSQK